MGGFDLFRCVRLDNGSWSEPEHMGHPLNTAGDEVMVSLDASGQSGFLSSSRQGGVDLDIFTVEVYDEPEERPWRCSLEKCANGKTATCWR